MKRHVRIERLSIDARGIPPAQARAAVEALGPALARALQGLDLIAPAGTLEAGAVRIATGQAPLADAIAAHVADRLGARR